MDDHIHVWYARDRGGAHGLTMGNLVLGKLDQLGGDLLGPRRYLVECLCEAGDGGVAVALDDGVHGLVVLDLPQLVGNLDEALQHLGTGPLAVGLEDRRGHPPCYVLSSHSKFLFPYMLEMRGEEKEEGKRWSPSIAETSWDSGPASPCWGTR